MEKREVGLNREEPSSNMDRKITEIELLEREVSTLHEEIVKLTEIVGRIFSAQNQLYVQNKTLVNMNKRANKEVAKYKKRFHIAVGVCCILSGIIITFVLLAI